MAISESQSQELKEYSQELAKVAVSLTAGVAVYTAFSLAVSATATNTEQKNITGSKKMSPTEDKTVLQSKETSASKTNSNLSQDEVAAKKR